VEIHRFGASDLDDSGWCHASSTGGGFSVSLPTNAFADLSTSGNAEDSVEIKSFFVCTLDRRQVKFTALASRRTDDTVKGDALEGFVERFEKQGSARERRISLGKINGIELRVTNRYSSAVARIYKGRTALYGLIVEAPSTIHPEEIEGDVQRFMDSFNVSDMARE